MLSRAPAQSDYAVAERTTMVAYMDPFSGSVLMQVLILGVLCLAVLAVVVVVVLVLVLSRRSPNAVPCPHCGAPAPPWAKFCPNCGRPMRQPPP